MQVGEGDAERNCCKVCRPFYPAAGTEGGGQWGTLRGVGGGTLGQVLSLLTWSLDYP